MRPYAVVELRSRGPKNGPGFAVAKFIGPYVPKLGRREASEARGEPAASAGIRGVVTDSTRAVIPGTEVQLLRGGETVAASTTDEVGQYSFSELEPATYQLDFHAEGFRVLRIFGVPVRERFTTEADCWLEIGSVTEVVEVQAKAAMLQTSTAALASAAATPFPIPRIRREFLETMLWRPLLETDSKGRAEIRFPLADNVTTWELLATASTMDGRIAVGEADLRVVQPLFFEYDPPSVLTQGDQVTAAAYLRNYSGESAPVRTTVGGDNGVTATLEGGPDFNLPSDGSTPIPHQIQAMDSKGEARVQVSAYGQKESDAIEKRIRLRPNGEIRNEVWSEVLSADTTLSARAPESSLPGTFGAVLRVYPNLLSHILDSGEALLEKPHGCGEQTISSTFPNLMALRSISAGAPLGEGVEKRARRNLKAGYRRLLGYRRASGGFAYFRSDKEPDQALTAYALEFLLQASKEIAVDPAVISAAARWLNEQLDEPDWSKTKQIYAAAVLAESGTADASWILPDPSDMDYAYRLATLLRLCLARDDHACAATATSRLTKAAFADSLPNPTPFFGSGRAGAVERIAVALKALAAASEAGYEDDPKAIGALIRLLLESKDEAGAWWTTQATIRALDALIEAAPPAGEPMQPPQASINGKIVTLAQPALGRAFQANIGALLDPGENEIKMLGRYGQGFVLAQAAVTYAIPWGAHVQENDSLAWRVTYDRTELTAGEAVTARIHVTPRNPQSGMLTAEVGLPPGAEVRQAALDAQVHKANGGLYRYDVLPDRVILYLKPGRPSDIEIEFRLRWPMNALTAPSTLYSYYDPDSTIVVEPTRFIVR